MINSFQNITTTVQTISTSLALVTPQSNIGYKPQDISGSLLPTLLFHTEGENVAHVQSDITDHFIEDNTAIQDQIALKPEMVTVHGFIGELNDVFPVSNPTNPTIITTMLNVESFIPQFTSEGQFAIDSAAAGYLSEQGIANAAVSVWGALAGGSSNTVIGSSGVTVLGSGQNLQQTIFQQFYLYWRSRTLFTIQTPWAVFSNMAIMEMRALQDDTTRMITDFYISFKLLRFSTTFLQSPSQFNGVSRANITTASLGQSYPVPVTGSLTDYYNSLQGGPSLSIPKI